MTENWSIWEYEDSDRPRPKVLGELSFEEGLKVLQAYHFREGVGPIGMEPGEWAVVEREDGTILFLEQREKAWDYPQGARFFRVFTCYPHAGDRKGCVLTGSVFLEASGDTTIEDVDPDMSFHGVECYPAGVARIIARRENIPVTTFE